uniref:Uncharacterized protein n=1 Tax=Anopheles coluzzii TaxID=1518534 RepID=A0A8W7P2W9_ANOCL
LLFYVVSVLRNNRAKGFFAHDERTTATRFGSLQAAAVHGPRVSGRAGKVSPAVLQRVQAAEHRNRSGKDRESDRAGRVRGEGDRGTVQSAEVSSDEATILRREVRADGTPYAWRWCRRRR